MFRCSNRQCRLLPKCYSYVACIIIAYSKDFYIQIHKIGKPIRSLFTVRQGNSKCKKTSQLGLVHFPTFASPRETRTGLAKSSRNEYKNETLLNYYFARFSQYFIFFHQNLYALNQLIVLKETESIFDI